MGPDPTRPGVARRPLDLAVGLAGVAILIVSAMLVPNGGVSSIEASVFRAVNGLPEWLEPPMQALQLLGVLAVGPLVCVGALAARRRRLALAAILVTVSKLGTERVVKLFVERQRPATSTPGAIARGVPIRGLAFVSGHVVLTTALAGVIVPYLPRRWKAVPWAVVAVVSFARIYLGAHNPLDVVGGAGLGLAIAGAVNLALGVPVEPAGRRPARGRPRAAPSSPGPGRRR